MWDRVEVFECAVMVIARNGRQGFCLHDLAAETSIEYDCLFNICGSEDDVYFEVLKKIVFELLNEMSYHYELSRKKALSQSESLYASIDFISFLFSNNAENLQILLDAANQEDGILERVLLYCESAGVGRIDSLPDKNGDSKAVCQNDCFLSLSQAVYWIVALLVFIQREKHGL